MTLLASSRFGRLGVIVDSGPEILPVSHVWSAPAWPWVSYETDGADERWVRIAPTRITGRQLGAVRCRTCGRTGPGGGADGPFAPVPVAFPGRTMRP